MTQITPRFEQRGRIVSAYVFKKFGPERGASRKAAAQLGINQGNFSSMLGGYINTPQKYIDALHALPDYIPEAPKDPWPRMHMGGGGFDAWIHLNEKSHSRAIDLHHAIFSEKEKPSFLTNKQMEEVVRKLIRDAHKQLMKNIEDDENPLS